MNSTKNESKIDKLNASEALYGFAGWLTSQTEPITIGADHDVAVWAEKVLDFCEANNLPELREGWQKRLVYPITND